MAIHVLSSDTPISSLMPSGGGSLASGDTIELSGHDLIIDADAASYPVTLTNASAVAHLELRDGGRIKLNKTLPTSICPWIDPQNPLPESNYTAGLTANASAEIQLLGNISLGGGPARLPTATRSGAFWALCQSSSGSSITFDRDFPLHAGDTVFNANARTQNADNCLVVVSYDSQSRTATLSGSSFVRTVGNLWGLLAGGIVINRISPSSTRYPSVCLNAPCIGGTINFFSSFVGNNNGAGDMVGTTSSLLCDRVAYKMQCGSYVGNNGLVAQSASIVCGQILADILCPPVTGWPDPGAPKIKAGELATAFINNPYCEIVAYSGVISGSVAKIVGKNLSVNSVSPFKFQFSRLVNSSVSGIAIGDTQFESSGTVSRVARSDFPADTDLPDAFYFAPATASDVPWRYEDYWVRKGETLRLSCRAMRGGDNGAARVAIGEMAVWVPAEGMPTLAEWVLDSGEPLVWRGGQIAWTNDTGEDRQVRVWSMASGINGAYIRVWRATGGAM